MSLLAFLLPVAGYLIGSLSSAVFVCRLLGLPDPRLEGSNNPGATNVLRLGGKKAAAITLAGDLAKGLVPVLIATGLGAAPGVVATTALGAFLGHLYPVFFGFRGGKGVATAAGIWAAVSWQVILILVGIWLAVVLASRYSSLAALSATAALPLVLLYVGSDRAFVAVSLVMTVLLVWRHRTNIGRLVRGEESRVRLTFPKS
ncbi:MAG: glycerol-3-phosphate 1-O-acyltransferase PlsY [Gammaproteobacteria bacterium]|nr:glycerol-3-phosphate 1-O-acyltransferase PlsY [Gammaproteobacteria bacterium]MDE0281460.1 glycerol-3-phosphate 1-O-acyltransferase PlsY [Gammaproteobacteria bacterium]MXY66106.1 glycerol-3-phosphate 1-O-acyltransferase PlsY [Gammaproteobacteria bacterium]MYG67593.1 glycerol-3-phosphate 1-O-acyltransferase PlsY [Gammaproteobacteria bacterium]